MEKMQEKKLADSLRTLLKKYFGYEDFRPGQLEIIQSVLAGKDTLAVMPTGGGKSLCYQIPALVFKGLTVVVSPLISLMQDQVSQLEKVGIPALFLNSSLEWDEYTANMAQIRRGEIKLLYCAPETLVTERMQSLFSQVEVSCLTIDEAHCISEWGHDFRPEYRQLSDVRRIFPKAVCLALTATATESVQRDIQQMLSSGKPFARFISSFNRENIFLEVVSKTGGARGLSDNADKVFPKARKTRLSRSDELVLEFLAEHLSESGIIYCFSRQQVDETSAMLDLCGIENVPYHAGFDDKVRGENQRLFLEDKVKIVVATVAFGMGINKPNVRFVIHYDLPKSVEQYYQEIGRAGRDGKPARALLLYSWADCRKIDFLLKDKSGKERASAEVQLKGITDFATLHSCRRQYLLGYFGERFAGSDKPEKCCDVCAMQKNAVPVDVTVAVQKILSAVIRTRERFGTAYVVDVLLGKSSQRIEDNGHDLLSVFGCGKEYDKEDWFELVRILVEEGFLKKSEDYGVLSLTAKARNVLKNRSPVFLPFMPMTKSNGATKTAKAGKAGKLGKVGNGAGKTAKTVQTREKGQNVETELQDDEGPLTDSELALLNALKKWRAEEAKKSGVPAFYIFSNKVLEALVRVKPATENALVRDVKGIGPQKAEKFGPDVLSLIAGFSIQR